MAAVFALVAMNVAAQDDQMMSNKIGGQKMMDKSKPTVAIIRADWCEACQKLEPTFKELMEQYEDRLNFVVLDVTTDEKVAESAKTARELGVARRYQVTATPTVIFVDAYGTIRYRGNRLPENYDQRLDALLTQGQ